jgi:hypothetical protein
MVNRVKKAVSRLTGAALDDVSVGATWSADGSQHSTDTEDGLPNVQAEEFAALHGRYRATVPSPYVSFNQRILSLEARVASHENTLKILTKESLEFRKIAIRFLLDRARIKLAKDLGLSHADWSSTFQALMGKGPNWLEQHHLSPSAIGLTAKGKGTINELGDHAAHKIKKEHVEVAVGSQTTDVAAWKELYDYVYS